MTETLTIERFISPEKTIALTLFDHGLFLLKQMNPKQNQSHLTLMLWRAGFCFKIATSKAGFVEDIKLNRTSIIDKQIHEENEFNSIPNF